MLTAFNSLFESLPDGVIVTDQGGRILCCNPAAERLFGYDRTFLIGQNVKVLMPEDRARQHDGYIRAYLETRIARVIGKGRVVAGQRRNGTTFPLRLALAEAEYEGEPAFVGIITDLSEQQRLQDEMRQLRQTQASRDDFARESAELRASIGSILHQPIPIEDKLQQVLRAIVGLSGLSLQRKAGVFIRAADGSGLELRQLYGDFSEEFIRRERFIPAGACLCGRAAISGELLISDDCFCDPRHEHRFTDMTAHGHYILPLPYGKEVLGVLFLYTEPHPARDPERIATLRLIGEMLGLAIHNEQLLQELVAARDAAQAAERAIGEFLTTMSHEIRTPLNAIIGMSYLLGQTRLEPEQHQDLRTIESSSKNLLALINDILDLSKIQAGQFTLDPHPFYIGELLTDLRAMFSLLARGKKIALDIPDLDPAIPPLLLGDGTRLRQCLINLINNAIKFTERGEVRLDVEFRGQDGVGQRPGEVIRLRFSVTDTGIGLSPEQMDRLFRPFAQADTSTTRRFGGSGLGLSIVKRIVELMGGRVGVDSTLAVGSTFWLEISLGCLDTPTPNGVQHLLTHPPRVLVIDDHAIDRQLYSHMCAHFGWEVESVDSGQAMLTRVEERLAEGRAFDCLVQDWRMPNLDGLGALEELHHRLGAEAPPAILVTADDHVKLLAAIQEDQTQTVLAKPVSASNLYNAVNEAVVSRRGGIRTHPGEREEDPYAGLAGVRVLVVDDNQINLTVITRVLQKQGAHVIARDSGERALEELSARPDGYDLISIRRL